MIQILIRNENEQYSVAELVQQAIEGGCRWIRLDLPEADDAFLKEVGDEVVPLCRESAVMLTIENNPEAARKMGLHGVHLSDKRFNAISLREELGPEAIIGVTVSEVSSALALAKADIDYVQLPDDFDDDRIARFMIDLREANRHFPVVANGDRCPEAIASLPALGVSGVVVGRPVYMAGNPVAATEAILKQISE